MVHQKTLLLCYIWTVKPFSTLCFNHRQVFTKTRIALNTHPTNTQPNNATLHVQKQIQKQNQTFSKLSWISRTWQRKYVPLLQWTVSQPVSTCSVISSELVSTVFRLRDAIWTHFSGPGCPSSQFVMAGNVLEYVVKKSCGAPWRYNL